MRPVIHSIRSRLRLTAAFVCAAACSTAESPAEAERVAPAGAPVASLPLPTDADTPLGIRLLRELPSGNVLAVESRQSVLWELDPAGRRAPRRLRDVEGRNGRVPIVSIAVAGDRVAVLLANGEAVVLSVDNLEVEQRVTDQDALSRPIEIEALGESFFALFETVQSDSSGGDRITSLEVRRLNGDRFVREWSRIKHRLSDLSTRVASWNSIAADGRRLSLGTSWPTTVEVLPVAGADSARVSLEGVPRRPLSSADLDRQRQALRSLAEPYRSQAQLVTHYPAILKHWIVPGGFAVAAASEDDSFSLDLYCGGRFVATRLAGSDIRSIWPWRNGVAVLVASPDDQYRLDFHEAATIGLSCP